METSDIKKLFEATDRAVPINNEKKEQTIEKMVLELKKQKSPVENTSSILLNHFLYMDKSVLYLYGILLCLEILCMSAARYMKIDNREIVTFCMIGSGIISISAIMLIDNVFFHKMAELGATCYFNTKQSIAAYMIMVESINIAMLVITMLYVGKFWKIAVFQMAFYVVTPFLLSTVVAFGMLLTEKGRKSTYSLWVCGFFLSIAYMMLSTIPDMFLVSSIGIWSVICVALAALCFFEIKGFFTKLGKGELLCMN